MNQEPSVTPRQTPAISGGGGQGVFGILAAAFMFWPAHWLSCGLAFAACGLAVIRILKLKPTFPNRLEAMLVVGLILVAYQSRTAVSEQRRAERLHKVMADHQHTKQSTGPTNRVLRSGQSTTQNP